MQSCRLAWQNLWAGQGKECPEGGGALHLTFFWATSGHTEYIHSVQNAFRSMGAKLQTREKSGGRDTHKRRFTKEAISVT